MISPVGDDAQMFWCPGCDSMHILDSRWTYNNDPQNPTISPSFRTNDNRGRVCHAFLTNGELIYLSDTTHAYKNQTIPLPDFPDWLTKRL